MSVVQVGAELMLVNLCEEVPPFRVHAVPTEDGADVGFGVLDRLRAGMLHRVSPSDVLKRRALVRARGRGRQAMTPHDLPFPNPGNPVAVRKSRPRVELRPP